MFQELLGGFNQNCLVVRCCETKQIEFQSQVCETRKMEIQTECVAHELINTELLDEKTIMENKNLRWMVFKVKQRGMTNYFDNITPQAGESADIPDVKDSQTKE